jgi:hypothetical protein
MREPPSPTVEYIHIELAEHDVIWAEGTLSETYLDDDNRGMFHNAADWRGDYGPVGDRGYCAPRITAGFELEKARQQMASFVVRRGEAT